VRSADNRQIDVLDASGLEVRGEEDLVAYEVVDDLDSRGREADRGAVARAPRTVLLELGWEPGHYLGFGLGPCREAKQLEPERDHTRFAVMPLV
jgi:hypothetical protein